jgi:prephenate dehydratase
MKKLKIGFQGNVGAYSENAAEIMYPHAEISGFRTLTDLFLSIDKGKIDLGVIPVENSSIGTITQSLDLMDEFNFRILGEYFMSINHSLLGFREVELNKVEKVYSHYAALNQCQRFLSKYPHWRLIPVTDTAGAVKMIKENNLRDAVAIAGEKNAGIYDLSVLASNISDYEHNQTRFWAVSRDDQYRIDTKSPSKISLVIRLNHRAGALHDCLNIFSILGINMTSLISRPDTLKPWSYVFFMDLELSEKEERFVLLKQNFEFLNIEYKSLGDYHRIES